jgi:outer membrane receptor protein involved in Fe transport
MNELCHKDIGKLFLNFITVFCLLLSVSVFAQVTSGNLQGIVSDQTGAVIPGAIVRIVNPQTGQSRETTTNNDGFYRFTSLAPSEVYIIEAAAANFASTRIENIIVRIGTENTRNVALGLVGQEATVIVTGDSAILETSQSQLSQSYNTRQLTELPILGGAIETFALLTPGVVTPGDADFTNGVGISANGNRGRSNNFQIDGQDNNDNSVAGPSLSITNTEAIGEVQIITNVFSAEFGRNSGAQVNAVTKSGTNAFRGSATYFLRNSALNTRSNIDKQTQGNLNFLAENGVSELSGLASRTKDPFTFNRFGVSLGGPIKKDKAFFFVAYQGDILRGENTISGIGTESMTFTRESALLARQLFPNATTAALTSTSVAGGPVFAQNVGRFFVLPPTLDTTGNGIVNTFSFGPNNPYGNIPTANLFSDGLYVLVNGVKTPLYFGEGLRVVPNRSGTDQIISRVDYNISDRDFLTARYIFDDSRNPLAVGRFLAGAIFDVPSRNNNLGLTYTRQISSKYTNEARFSFSRLDVKFGDPNNLPGPGISIGGFATQNFDFGITFGTQNNLPQSRKVDVYQFQDTLISTLGNHSLKFGADIRLQRVNNFFLPNFLGTYVFNGSNPFVFYESSPSPAAGFIPEGTPFVFGKDGSSRAGFRATAYENLLLNNPRQITFAIGNPEIKTRQEDFFFFVQDDWRVRKNLTLNLGLRYEVSTTPFNPIIKDVNAREADPSRAIFNQNFPLSTRTAQKLPIDANNLAPRLGFAYSPSMRFLGSFFKNRQTVIRGGFGLSYDPSFFNIVLNTVTAAPFAAAGSVVQVPGEPNNIGFPFLPNTTAQLNSTPGTNNGDPRLFNQTRVDPNFYNPYSIAYNFGIQQEFSKNSVLEIRYVGTRLIGQFQTVNGNPNVQFLNRAAFCLGLDPGSFSNGLVVGGAPTPTTRVVNGQTVTILTANQVACGQNNPSGNPGVTPITTRGFQNRPGTNGDGRLDPTFGAVRTRINGASATYNGLQVRFDQRFGQFLILNANYSFSKTLDNASEIFSTGGGGQSVATAQRFFDITSGERGLSAFHQKHSFVSSFIADLPFYKEQRGVVGKLLGGYRVSGIVRLGSGRPYTPIQAIGVYDNAFDTSFLGVGSLRPFNGNPNAPTGTIAFGYGAACLGLFGGPECNYNGGTATPGSFIIFNTLNPGSTGIVVPNAAAAAQQARLIYNDFGLFARGSIPNLNSLEAFNYFRTPYGDVGRNTFLGNNLYQVDLAMFKTLNLSERLKVEFRVEAQNVLNERNFGVPDAFTESASTGFTVGSFQNPGFNFGSVRQLRFGVRLLF